METGDQMVNRLVDDYIDYLNLGLTHSEAVQQVRNSTMAGPVTWSKAFDRMILPRGAQVRVNGNSEARVLDYDKELDMYNVRLWRSNRKVGDVVVPRQSIEA